MWNKKERKSGNLSLNKVTFLNSFLPFFQPQHKYEKLLEAICLFYWLIIKNVEWCLLTHKSYLGIHEWVFRYRWHQSSCIFSGNSWDLIHCLFLFLLSRILLTHFANAPIEGGSSSNIQSKFGKRSLYSLDHVFFLGFYRWTESSLSSWNKCCALRVAYPRSTFYQSDP